MLFVAFAVAAVAASSCDRNAGDKNPINTRTSIPASANTGTITNEGTMINGGTINNQNRGEIINLDTFLNKHNLNVGESSDVTSSVQNYGNFINSGTVQVDAKYTPGTFQQSYTQGTAWHGFWNYKKGSVLLESGSTFNVKGTFVNQDSATVTNKGSFTVSGVVVNEATFTNKAQSNFSATGTGEVENRKVFVNEAGATAATYGSAVFQNLVAFENEGTFDNSGFFHNFGTISQKGDLEIAGALCVYAPSEFANEGFSGAGLYLNFKTTTTTGTLDTLAGSTFRNDAEATYEITAGTWTNNGTIKNLGLMRFYGGRLDNSQDFENDGSVEIKDHIMANTQNYNNNNGATTDVYSNGQVLNSGTFMVKDGSFFNAYNDSYVKNTYTFESKGTTLVSGEATVFENHATVNTHSIFLVVQGSEYKQVSGTTTVDGATSKFENGANVNIVVGDLINEGEFGNYGTVTVETSAKFTVQKTKLENHATISVEGNGKFNVSSGSTFENTHVVEGTGTFDLDGTASNVGNISINTFNANSGSDFTNDKFGVVSSSDLTVTGDFFVQKKSSSVNAGTLQIDGAVDNTDYSKIECSVKVDVNGDLSFTDNSELISSVDVEVDGSMTFNRTSKATVSGTTTCSTKCRFNDDSRMTNDGTLDAIDVIFSGKAQLTNEGTIQQNSPTAFKFQGESKLNNNGTVTTTKLHFVQNAEFTNTGDFSNNGDFHVSGDAKVTNGDTTSASATATTGSDWKFSDNAQFINMAVFTSENSGDVTCKDSCVFRNKHHFLVEDRKSVV